MTSVVAVPAQDGALLQLPKDFKCGDWTPIKNIKDDSYMQDMGGFAVKEHNNKTGDDLDFLEVNEGKSRVEDGIVYYLVIRTTRNCENKIGNYQAVVLDKPPSHTWTLKSFDPLPKV